MAEERTTTTGATGTGSSGGTGSGGAPQSSAGSKPPDVLRESVTAPPTGPKPVVVSGKAGRPFNIDGEGFGPGGSTSSLEISGRLVGTTRWLDHSIKGELPPDIKPGDVVIRTADGRVVKGRFNG